MLGEFYSKQYSTAEADHSLKSAPSYFKKNLKLVFFQVPEMHTWTSQPTYRMEKKLKSIIEKDIKIFMNIP